MNNDYFPVFMDIRSYKIVVVGAGRIALRRVETLLKFTDQVTVVAPDIRPEFRELEAQGKVLLKCKAYEREDILDADMVLAALDDEQVNRDIYSACRCMGILVNIASDKTKCDFYFPGIVKRENVVVGITASGEDHRLAKEIRLAIEDVLGAGKI